MGRSTFLGETAVVSQTQSLLRPWRIVFPLQDDGIVYTGTVILYKRKTDLYGTRIDSE